MGEQPQKNNEEALSVQYRIYSVDKDTGKVIKDTGMRECKSLLYNFMGILYVQMAQTTLTLTKTDGNTQSVGAVATNFYIRANPGDITNGIVVGSSSQAVNYLDHDLIVQIVHGSSAGQLNYEVQGPPSPPLFDGTYNFDEITRAFTNNSPGSVTINEIGLYCRAATSYYFCIIRDVVGGGYSCPQNSVTFVSYQIRAAL